MDKQGEGISMNSVTLFSLPGAIFPLDIIVTIGSGIRNADVAYHWRHK